MEKLTPIKLKLAEFWEKRAVLVLAVSALLFVSIFSIYLLAIKSGRGKPTFPPDTTIVTAKGAYAFENTTNVFQTQFKNKATDPDGIAFSNNLGKITFFTPENQSFGKLNSVQVPIVSGGTITYSSIFPQVDLRYTLSSTRLLEEFIIKDAETATLITKIEQLVKTDATYKQNDDGSIVFSNGDNTAFILPHPVMYEEDDPTKISDGIVYEITDNAGQIIISKVITAEGKAWILNKDRKYPIVIDLVIDNADVSSGWLSSDSTNTSISDEAVVKYEGAGSVKIQTASNTSLNIDLMEYATNGDAQTAYDSNALTSATGGTITTDGAYTLNTFTASGTFTPDGPTDTTALVVAGGGSGGSAGETSNLYAGGGGGGGGMLEQTVAVSAGAYTVTVGNGSQNSVFDSLTAIAGGAGGRYDLAGVSGGSGGGGGGPNRAGGSGTSGQGYAGGTYPAGGGGAGGVGASGGGAGGVSVITGATYSHGGAAGTKVGGPPPGAASGAANSGDGGGGGSIDSGTGATSSPGSGGSGIVVIQYLTPPYLQSYSEATIKTEGSYALKGVANETTSLNKTITHTFSSPLDLSDAVSITFDLRASRTGSNLKIGVHDSGGITTEVTPNITSIDTYQSVTWDLLGVAATDKDAIDQIIITVVNADATNTFYLDNVIANKNLSLNDTVTLTTASTDLSANTGISFWVRSPIAGTYAQIEMGEATSSEQTHSITINSADTWENKTWDITGISAASRDAVTKYAFRFTNATQGSAFYFDDIRTLTVPDAPTIGTPTAPAAGTIRWTFTDTAFNENGFKVFDDSNNLLVTCEGENLTYCDETGLDANTQYTRKVSAYNAEGNSPYSTTASKYTLAVTPSNPVASNRTATTVDINPNPGLNPGITTFAIYKEFDTTVCDGSGGSYVAANGTDNGATAVWQTDAVWDTVTVNGLTSEHSYIFCVKAKNADDEAETGFSGTGSSDATFVPLSGDFICTADTIASNTFTNRYVDGNNPDRYVIALDTVSGDTNSSTFELKSCIMTLNSTDTLAVGQMTLTGGSIAIAEGGEIKIGSPVWTADPDSDGYSDGKLYVGTQPSGGIRKANVTTLTAIDCNSSVASVWLSHAQCYADSDADTYTNGLASNSTCLNTSSCATATAASDSVDGATATGYAVGALRDAASGTADCYDTNANAKPTSTYCGTVDRGDGSYDYNCSGGNTTCGTTMNYLGTTYAQSYRYCSGTQCLYGSANAYTTTTTPACGGAGYYCNTMTSYYQSCACNLGYVTNPISRCSAVISANQGCQ